MSAPLRLFDTHCHLDDPALTDLAPPSALLTEARKAGVQALVVPAVHPDQWTRLLRVCDAHSGVYPALGVHPHALPSMDDDALRAHLDRLPEQLRLSDARAVGEIGLDHRTARTPEARARQLAAFERQLDLARQLNLPPLIHVVKAHDAALRAVRRVGLPPAGGVLHGYTGSADMVPVYAREGLAFGFGGPITWPNARKPLNALRAVPPERLLIETDAPYQTPHPHRPAPNRPAWLAHIAARAAEVLGEPLDALAERTWRNAQRLLGRAELPA